MTLTISLVQMDCRLGDLQHNFATAERSIEEAARRGSNLVLLPELWSTAYDLEHASLHASALVEDAPEVSEAISADAQNSFARLAALALRHRVWLGGSILEEKGGRFYNCFALYTPDGALAAAYRKLHLFRLMQEEQYLAPGDAAVMVDLPGGKAGLAICYDLRFPELFRSYALKGASLMLLPAEWPHPRLEHWRTLLRARAIENQCFVAACNRVGETKGSRFFGASAVISPWGETLIEAGETEALLTVTIDLADAHAARSRIPVFEDRRSDLYGSPGE